MAEPIELLSFNRKCYGLVGIPPLQPDKDAPSSNSKNLIIVTSLTVWFLSSAVFFVNEANSMIDFGLSFFAASAAVAMNCLYLDIIWRIKIIHAFIEDCERFIEQSKQTFKQAFSSSALNLLLFDVRFENRKKLPCGISGNY